MNQLRRIVVTGIGVLSPIGIGRDNFAEALLQGKTGFRKISLFDTDQFQVRIAGEIADFDPVAVLGKKGLRSLDRSTLLLNSAAKLALDDSRFEVTDGNTHWTGVAVGTTFGSLHSIFQFDREGLIEGPRYVNPSHFPNTVINSPASQVSIRFKIKGFNTTISTGFCAGLDAVSYAADFIKFGRADTILAGGVEELCEETFLGFHSLGCLSGLDGREPVCRPFDADRNGFVFSEGAAIFVLEEERHALDRGADILAVIKGCGNAFDSAADRSFSHAGTGLANAIKLALKDADLCPEDIGYISACANATRGLDSMETRAIKEVFGRHVGTIPISGVKSMIGESFSASGALSLATAVAAINRGFIPPTMNYRKQDPECDLDYVVDKVRKKRTETALVATADPYGNNTAVVVGKYT